MAGDAAVLTPSQLCTPPPQSRRCHSERIQPRCAQNLNVHRGTPTSPSFLTLLRSTAVSLRESPLPSFASTPALTRASLAASGSTLIFRRCPLPAPPLLR